MNKKVFIMISVVVFLILLTSTSLAASISISSSKSTVSPGETFSVSVTGNDATGRVNVSGGNISPSSQWIENNTVSFSVVAPQSGSITITASGEFSDSQGIDFTDSKSVTVSVIQPQPEPTPEPSQPSTPTTPTPQPSTPSPTTPEPAVKSSVAILADLGIRPNDFSGFSKNPNKETWQVTVPSDVSQIEVYAKAGQNGTIISGTGIVKLIEGTNSLKVVVQSEDGTHKKTYTILVTREVASGEITPNTDENADGEIDNDITTGLSKLEVEGLTFNSKFETNEYKYTIEGKLEDFNSVEEFKNLIKAEANFEGAKIEITSEEEEFKVGRNKILITVKDTDGREIAIYTIILKLTEKEETVIGNIKEDKKEEKIEGKIDWNKIIVIVAIGLIAIYAVVVSVIAYKQRKVIEFSNWAEKKEENEDDFIKGFSDSTAVINERKENLEEEKIEREDITKESEEEIRRRKIEEFLKGRESRH